MSIPSISIKNPVFTFMLNCVLILFGMISMNRIGIDEFPDIDFPVIIVYTSYPGASPEVVDSSITSLVENELSGISGVNNIKSDSSANYSVTIMEFNLDKDINVAFNEIQSKVNQISSKLPQDAKTPIIEKARFDSEPIFYVFINADRQKQELTEFTRKNIAERLRSVEGVAKIELVGNTPRVIRVDLNLVKLNANGITAAEVYNSLKSEQISIPGGVLTENNINTQLSIDLKLKSIKEIENHIISYKNNAPILLKEVAEINDDTKDKSSIFSFNGKQGIGIGIVKIPGQNPVQVITNVKEKLKEIFLDLPEEYSYQYMLDDSKAIHEKINNLYEHITVGVILTAIVVWLFLKNIRSTFIISASIPVSLLAAIAGMLYFGYTFNNITLLAMLLLIGIVVDDSIVVLENIYRSKEKGLDNKQAAIEGSNEVVFAVVATSLVLICIFAPVIFLDGIVGMFLKSLAVVMVVGVAASSVVSLTLTPMLCANFIGNIKTSETGIYAKLENVFKLLESFYVKLISWCLNHPWKVIIATLLSILICIPVFKNLGKQFLPQQDDSTMLIRVSMAKNSTLEKSKEKISQINKILRQKEEIKDIISVIKKIDAKIYLELLPKEKRNKLQHEIRNELYPELQKIPGIKVSIGNTGGPGGGRSESLQFNLTGAEYNATTKLAKELTERIKSLNIGIVQSDVENASQEYKLILKRNRIKEMGIKAQDIAKSLSILTQGATIDGYSDGKWGNDNYEIQLKSQDNTIKSASDLKSIYIRNNNNELISLDSLATLKHDETPSKISKANKEYSILFYGNPKVPMGEALTKIKEIARQILPTGYSIKLTGQASEFEKTSKNMAFAMLNATILVYMVLASQFNSFLQPLVLMVSLPLALIGGVVGLWLLNLTLNIYSMIGMVLLMGLAAKNSILLVDFTNVLRSKGKSIEESLIEACPLRMRPVLMTSLTLIFAMLPAVFSNSQGSENNAPLSAVVMFGMISSTFLTLVVIPAVYLVVERAIEKYRKKEV